MDARAAKLREYGGRMAACKALAVAHVRLSERSRITAGTRLHSSPPSTLHKQTRKVKASAAP